MALQNHLIDPAFFFDAIEEFSFNYRVYTAVDKEINEHNQETYKYEERMIRGSLQPQGRKLSMTLNGNYEEMRYNFYCKALYRIDIGDIIEYKNRYMRVDEVKEYDEFGVRQCSLSMINLNAERDFADYIAYLRGEKII